MGDFNEVRRKEDRFSEWVCTSGMNAFNKFITDGGLIDFNMGGRRFTRMSDDGRCLSKIDRFLVCNGFINKWNAASITVLPRLHSDHSPLILVNDILDFGPSPFKFYNSWLKSDGLKDVVLDSWNTSVGDLHCSDRRLVCKLKKLKHDIRS